MQHQPLPQSAMSMLLKNPRVYVLGSSHFFKEMVATKDKLVEMGVNCWIHPHYEAFAKGEMKEHLERFYNGEEATLKREFNYLKEHYKHILESDAILIINAEKKGKKNYIGGNVLIEMGQAYVNDKKIFLAYDLPEESPYLDEIISVYPICLQGNLENIKKHL